MREVLGQVLLDAVEVELALLVQHQPRRAVARHLAAQLAAYAAAGAGDQYRFAVQAGVDAGLVELHGLAAEQVFGFDVAHAVDLCAGLQLVGRGHGDDGQAGQRGQLEEPLALAAAQ